MACSDPGIRLWRQGCAPMHSNWCADTGSGNITIPGKTCLQAKRPVAMAPITFRGQLHWPWIGWAPEMKPFTEGRFNKKSRIFIKMKIRENSGLLISGLIQVFHQGCLWPWLRRYGTWFFGFYFGGCVGWYGWFTGLQVQQCAKCKVKYNGEHQGLSPAAALILFGNVVHKDIVYRLIARRRQSVNAGTQKNSFRGWENIC